MTIHVPILEEWSSEVANDIALHKALATDEARTEADIRQIRTEQSTGSNRHERALLIASGKKPSQDLTPDINAKISHLEDIRAARTLQFKNEADTRHREGKRLCLELKPAYNASAKLFADSMVVAHSALVEMAALETKLKAQSIPFYPTICNFNAEKVFGWPTDRTSDFAILLRECVERKHLKSMPKELS
jgi:hypothetical protein